jgi:FtsP/CotA-like multicopper oxidase with cupredoxin domain
MGSIADRVNRRRLMGVLGLSGAGALASAAIPAVNTTLATAATAPIHHEANTAPKAAQDELTADEMDAMHEEGVKAFPAKTKGLGGQPLAFEEDGDTMVFRLTCDVVDWEYAPGQTVEGWGYNGVLPGPEIRVTEGDKVRVHVTNNLPQSTAVHWHGLIVPNNQDGVPFITQPPIKPGETFTYEFPIREGNAGSHMYHSHHNAAEQVGRGLLGAFIVEPKDPASRPAFDKEYTMILNDGVIGGFTLNGKGFPATQPLTAKKGEKVLVRYMNEGQMIHPMHLHGMPQLVIAQDGWLLPQPYMADTIHVDPGQRVEVIVDATEVGVWAYHCHVLTHAESAHGMFGMVTALIVEE